VNDKLPQSLKRVLKIQTGIKLKEDRYGLYHYYMEAELPEISITPSQQGLGLSSWSFRSRGSRPSFIRSEDHSQNKRQQHTRKHNNHR
jgi:hypothetical protein